MELSRTDRRRIERNPQGHKVCLSWLSNGWPTQRMMVSTLNLSMWDRDHGQFLYDFIGIESSPRLAASRCDMVQTFINRHTCNWMLFVDSDMEFDPDVLVQMFAVIEDHPEVKILGGLCFAGGHGERMYPTLYVLTSNDPIKMDRLMKYPEDGLVKVSATGAAFLLVHRQVYEEMWHKFHLYDDGTPNPHPWYKDSQAEGEEIGEDIWFCLQAGMLGYDVWVHTGIKIGHVKTFVLDESVYRRQFDLQLKLNGPGAELI